MALSRSAGHSPSPGTFLPNAGWSQGRTGPVAPRAVGHRAFRSTWAPLSWSSPSSFLPFYKYLFSTNCIPTEKAMAPHSSILAWRTLWSCLKAPLPPSPFPSLKLAAPFCNLFSSGTVSYFMSKIVSSH